MKPLKFLTLKINFEKSNYFAYLFRFAFSVFCLAFIFVQAEKANAQKSAHNLRQSKLKAKTRTVLIIAGKNVGDLHLGDSRARAIELFGRLDTEYDYDIKTKLNCSKRKELRFWELRDKTSPLHFDYGNGAWVYLKNDKVVQIKVQSQEIKTSEGLTLFSQPNKVRRFYPNIKTFVELNSGANVDGGRNLIFWIDEQQGIAFEFQYMANYKARRVAYIYVFEPNTEFLPEGCIYLETQGWQEIKPFSIEEPKGMQEQWEKQHR